MLIMNSKYSHTFILVTNKIFICSLCMKHQTEMISNTYLFCTRL